MERMSKMYFTLRTQMRHYLSDPFDPFDLFTPFDNVTLKLWTLNVQGESFASQLSSTTYFVTKKKGRHRAFPCWKQTVEILLTFGILEAAPCSFLSIFLSFFDARITGQEPLFF